MPRLKGTRVIFCKTCRRRIVGLPGKRIACQGCGRLHVVPKRKK